MTSARSAFAGGDQRYLRGEQYRNSDRLKRRAVLHGKYSTATVSWHDWVGSALDLSPSTEWLRTTRCTTSPIRCGVSANLHG